MSGFVERLFAGAWNRVFVHSKTDGEERSGLDLGFRVIDGELQRSRASLPDSKRCEHLAILGKTGQGKSFFLRHLSTQDIPRGRGGIFFDLHGDSTPFLLRVVAAEERRTGSDL